MKGTEKQIEWAQDIIKTWAPIFTKELNNHYDQAKAQLESGIEKAQSAGRERMAQRKIDQLKSLESATEILASLDQMDASSIIENRTAIMCQEFAHGFTVVPNTVIDAAYNLNQAFGK